MYYCKFCCKECKNHNSVRNHERLCKINPDKQLSNFILLKGVEPWNKGLTKDTSETIASQSLRISETMKTTIASGNHSGAWSNGYWTKERRELKSLEKKKLYSEFPEKHPNRKLAGNRNKMTYPEKVAFDWLNSNNIEFEHQLKILDYFVDFCIEKIIIEIDGERWHPLNNENDRIRDEILASNGYTIYRIRSKEHIENRLKEIFRSVGKSG